MRKWMGLGVFLVGCGSSIISPTDDVGADAEESGDTAAVDQDEPDDDGADDEGPAPLENPTIQYASAVCREGTVGLWQLSLVADDPQGIQTVTGGATAAIYPVGSSDVDPTHSVDMSCDENGRCGQNYNGEDENVLCSDATSWEFHFTIMDEDGYLSSTEVVVGSVD